MLVRGLPSEIDGNDMVGRRHSAHLFGDDSLKSTRANFRFEMIVLIDLGKEPFERLFEALFK